ncbi:MAG: hypothetical protein CVT92_13335 [Bacteroidetes bacterium HGW-Bacteroidetes-1]|jgi:hypothetical protein|nr:MAG: hypothetical protein CVT92_13335 [Bacteroidetes bacterium HGW-Bacteroidetes-1]
MQYKGFWWFFGNKEEDIPGILEIIEGESFRLTVFFGEHTSLAKKLQPYFYSRFLQKPPTIIGIAKSEKNKDLYFSLFECEFEYFRFAKLREVSFTGRVLLKHSLVEDLSKVKLGTAFFKPQFLDTWINEKAIKTDYDWASKDYEIRMHYKQPEAITLFKDSNKRIYIYYRANFDGPPNEKFNLTQSAFINIEFKNAVGYNYLQQLVDKLRNWYSIAIGLPVSIDMLEARKIQSADLDDEKYVELFIKDDRIFSSKNILRVGADLIPFQSEMIKNGQALKNWFNNYELIKPSLQIFIETLYNKHLYSQNKFLNFVFALEIYHRRKFNNFPDKVNSKRGERVLSCVLKKDEEWLRSKLEKQKETINLETRLDNLFKLYVYITKPLKINTKKTIVKIVQTRHRLVHHSEKTSPSKLLNEEAIDITAQKLRIVLQAVFLTEMGFNQEFITNHIRRPFNNSYYFDMFRSTTKSK